MIDEYFDYCFGELEYRSLRFETEILDVENYQGNVVGNPKNVITREYPAAWKKGDEPYYPMNDAKNNELFEKYKKLAAGNDNVIFGGRLGRYKYFDMHQVIETALDITSWELK